MVTLEHAGGGAAEAFKNPRIARAALQDFLTHPLPPHPAALVKVEAFRQAAWL